MNSPLRIIIVISIIQSLLSFNPGQNVLSGQNNLAGQNDNNILSTLGSGMLIQVGAFQKEANAIALRNKLATDLNNKVLIVPATQKEEHHQAVVQSENVEQVIQPEENPPVIVQPDIIQKTKQPEEDFSPVKQPDMPQAAKQQEKKVPGNKQSAIENSAGQPIYTTSRIITERPVIDGKLDDEAWKVGSWAGEWHQWIPNEGAKPTYPTDMNIQYDDKNIYVAFRAWDYEPDKILKLAAGRDQFIGDVLGIAFDSYRDYRSGFEFSVTAWGQKCDLVKYNPARNDLNFNPVWKAKVGMEDSAWVAEFEIPLSQLRYSSQDEQVWGMHTSRSLYRYQEYSNWEKQTKTGPGEIYNYGELQGIKGLKKSRRLEIMPFTLGDLKTMKKEPENPFTDKGRTWGGNMGLDAKIGVSSNFTIAMTVNPDFGQVESDPSDLNLTAFETFFMEKRPFFMEGSNIFEYELDNQSLFYSRRIGHAPSLRVNSNDSLFAKSPDNTTILSALKFSGTSSKGLSVGVIQSITANEYAKLIDTAGNETTRKVEPLTNYVVARLQKGYNSGTTTIGGIFTSTNRFIEDESLDFLSRDAYTGGLDLLHYMKDKEFYVETKLMGSYVSGSKEAITALQESSARYYQRPGADYLKYDTTRTRLSGNGGRFRIGKGSKGFWRYSTGVNWISPGLEVNDLGYMNFTDKIDQENALSFLIIKSFSIFRTLNLGLTEFNSWNFNGTYLGSGANFTYSSTFQNKWSLTANLRYTSEAIDTRILRGGNNMIVPSTFRTTARLGTDRSKKIIAGLTYGLNKSGNNSSSGYQIAPSISIRPVSNLKFEITASHSVNSNSLQYITTKNYLSEKRYILGTIDQKTLELTFRVDLNITPEFSIQYYGSPYVSRGKYSEFKRVTDPQAKLYEDRFSVFDNPQLIGGTYYELDEDNDMVADYNLGNPDFNFHQLRSNLVAKWEYRLGSFVYFVWSSERTGRTASSDASIGDSYKELGNAFPNNIFLIKLSYWFSL